MANPYQKIEPIKNNPYPNGMVNIQPVSSINNSYYPQHYTGSLALDKVVNNSERYATPASTKTTTGVRSSNEPDRSAQLYNTVYPNMTTSYDISGTTGRTRADDASVSAMYRGGIGGSGGISGRANFVASDAYNQAMAYTNQLLSQINSGRTQYTDRVNELMDSIANRASFSYDPDTDPLFQNYLNGAMASGKTAMQDTIGQASALTGGYGSSYATASANGAYNNFVQDAYNNLPEFYETALNAYNNETNDLYGKLGMYTQADERDYGRLTNAYGLNYASAQDMYGREYSNYWDSLNYNTDVDKYNQDLAYKYNALAQDQAQYEASMAYKMVSDAQSAQVGASGSADASGYTPKAEKMGEYRNEALEAYNAGGKSGLTQYLDMQGFSDATVDDILSFVAQYGDVLGHGLEPNLKR